MVHMSGKNDLTFAPRDDLNEADLQFARDSQWNEFILARAKTIY